ncbi:MAG: hypothetical protein JO217_10735, partial [Acidobacteriaceae bacterium]|nr:hypothetical protein [Acidobacteriaceae bacterium]
TDDHLEMSLPPTFIERMPDDEHVQAGLDGPIVLAGDLGDGGLTPDLITSPNAPQLRRLPINVPTFRARSDEPAWWIKPGDRPLAFRTTDQQTNVTLVPLNSVSGTRHSVYWQVL